MQGLIDKMKEFHTKEDPGLHQDLKGRVARILLDLETEQRQIHDLTSVEVEDLSAWFGVVWKEILEESQ